MRVPFRSPSSILAPSQLASVAGSCLLISLACSPPIDDSQSLSPLGTSGTQGVATSSGGSNVQPTTSVSEEPRQSQDLNDEDEPAAAPSSENQDFDAPGNEETSNPGAASDDSSANASDDANGDEPAGPGDEPDPASDTDAPGDAEGDPNDPPEQDPPAQDPPQQDPPQQDDPSDQEPPEQDPPAQDPPDQPEPPPLEAGCPPPQLLCDDFEASLLDAFPSSPQWLTELGGCGSHVTDGALASSGERSLRADGTAYPECMVHADVSGQDELFIRSFVRLGAPSTESGHHVSVLEVGTSANQDDPEFRVGFRADAPCNDPGLDVTVGGLSAGERTECSGFDLAANRFACFEVHYLRQGSSLTFDVRVDGQVVVPETTYEGLVGDWATGDAFFKFGRASYGGNNTFSVWHDDVVVSTQPIGCN